MVEGSVHDGYVAATCAGFAQWSADASFGGLVAGHANYTFTTSLLPLAPVSAALDNVTTDLTSSVLGFRVTPAPDASISSITTYETTLTWLDGVAAVGTSNAPSTVNAFVYRGVHGGRNQVR